MQPILQQSICGKNVPFHPARAACALLHRVFPIRSSDRYWRRLDRSLDQQTISCAPLGSAGNFLSTPKQIRFLIAGKALAGSGFAAFRRKDRGRAELLKGRLYPLMNALVALNRSKGVPLVNGWKNQAVGPIGVVRDEAACGWPANQRPQ